MSYLQKYSKKVQDFTMVCKRLADRMYVTSQGGNLSYKLEDNLVLISPTCVSKSDISEMDVVFIDLEGKIVEGTRKPTGEMPMYLNFYRDRPDIKSVIHCHPPYTNAFTILKGTNWLMRPVFPETVAEVGPVPLVPYGEPLTQKLADNFDPFVKKYNAFLMENHGLTILSTADLWRTMQLVDILEISSISILQALAIGEVKELTREDVQNLENTMKTRNLPMIGAPGVNVSMMDLYFNEE
ncbi:MAG: class II aldolase/adducin family protein [Chloroflexota bacterium]|nr:class II aldolase/adducin family protein [Chloroflexota bacterium]